MADYPLFDRDLSWLSFNYRVLLEAKSSIVPLLERLRFLAIYSSNLDEFFRVRVASLRRLAELSPKKIEKHLDFDPQETLTTIHEKVEGHLQEYGKTLQDVIEALKKEGIFIHRSSLHQEHIPQLNQFFKTKVLGFLRPSDVDEEFPFIRNKALYFAVTLIEGDETRVSILNIPSGKCSRFYSIRDDKGLHYYFLDDLIRNNLHLVYPNCEVIGCHSFKLNKDADLQIDDEFSGNLVSKIEKQIKKRDLGDPARLLIDSSFPDDLLALFMDKLGVTNDEVSHGGRYHNLNDFFQIRGNGNKNLEYPSQPPIRSQALDASESIFAAIDKQDHILHFPYQSYNYILQFFNEAAIHPDVTEINVTFYRMAEDSMIGEALLSAARNGKKVHVFMEVKARFDEENNLRWAERMQDAGINIQYSMPGLKVHAKVALVRMEKEGETRFYGFFGTGNLNEKTARIYCDHGLLSSHPEMTCELDQVFRFLLDKKEPEGFQHLIVSQFGAMEKFKALIDREIQAVEAGLKGKIIVKINNLEEPKLIKRLYKAAEAGVEVQVLARSICCLVPGFAGIEVSRIVDRYLEHARIFYFHNDGNPEIFAGSSDWMKRNLRRRVEVTFPIYHPEIKEQMIKVLELQLADNTNRVLLSPQIENLPVISSQDSDPVNAQIDTYRMVKELNG